MGSGPGSEGTAGRVPSDQLVSALVTTVCSIHQSSWGSIVAVTPVIFVLWLLGVNSDLDLVVPLS